MKLTMYSIFDTRIKEFDAPVLHNLKPDDYYEQIKNALIIGTIEAGKVRGRVLYCLGEFDNKTGKVALLTEPVSIGGFDDLIPQPDEGK